MSYKTIVVHLDLGPRRAERLKLSIGLAETFDAHLVGLFALGAARIPNYALVEAGPTILEIVHGRRGEAAQQAQREFNEQAGRLGELRTEWRFSAGDPLAAMHLSSRYADLVVLGQPDPSGEGVEGMAPGFASEVLLSCGRPVLFVPYAGRFARVGKRVLIAWNASPEAARAVSDALPLLARADAVDVVAFDPDRTGSDHGEVPGADIGLFLARHGVKVSVARQGGTGIDVGSQILSRAADNGSDLIVMGGYGHTRIRELVLGGATRTLLESMTVPVLMSH
jgi:nucleotide-binding universal stress UspA family protein